MTKTPEELADEYTQEWWGHYREDNMTLATRQAFLAGYKAAKPEVGTSDYLQYLYVTYLCTKAKAESGE